MTNEDNFSQIVTNYFKNDYRERGKIKWNGYFLSDHTSSLKRAAKIRHDITVKLDKMTLDEMKCQLQYAFINYCTVIVQQDFQNPKGQMERNIFGPVDGFSDRRVVINGKHILFENMRSVEIEDVN